MHQLFSIFLQTSRRQMLWLCSTQIQRLLPWLISQLSCNCLSCGILCVKCGFAFILVVFNRAPEHGRNRLDLEVELQFLILSLSVVVWFDSFLFGNFPPVCLTELNVLLSGDFFSLKLCLETSYKHNLKILLMFWALVVLFSSCFVTMLSLKSFGMSEIRLSPIYTRLWN